MSAHIHEGPSFGQAHCCNSRCSDVSRRSFLSASGIALSAAAMGGIGWSTLAAQIEAGSAIAPPPRKPLVVKPIFTFEIPQRRPQTSWRNWGGIQTQADADAEVNRINGELEKLKASADYPLTILPIASVRNPSDLAKAADLATADAIIVYAAGGPQSTFDAINKTGKHVMFFIRHRSGPVYLWYEIISPRYLHQHGDSLAVKGIDNDDVVIDKPEELQWRMRSLCGLKNSLGMKIVAIGGPGGWATPNAPDLARAKWKLNIETVTYEQLKPILASALNDDAAVRRAAQRADAYLADPGVKLETEKQFVVNAFVLEEVFRGLMAKANAPAMTINACMGAIMPISKTTACLTLSLLNDGGYLAFCESDFVVIPSGILLAGISGKPHFLNDPTYPHDGLITLAHCTSPRKMDGKTLEPARLVTHFESDYGASPKVEMRKGQVVTNIIPDFASAKYVGFLGEIADAPFLPICRSQIEVAYKIPDAVVARNMPGFHWEMVYGDYMNEMGYALKKIPIGWERLG